MRKKTPGIKWKLFVYLFSFCVLLLIILAFFQTVFLDAFYKITKERQVKQITSEISRYAAAGDWDSIAGATEEPYEVFIEVWDADGNLTVTSGNFRDGMYPQMKPDVIHEIIKQVQEEGNLVLRNVANAGPKGGGRERERIRESIICANRVDSTDGGSYVVLVNAEISPVNATVETLRLQLVYISIIMIILAIGLSLLLAKRISEPIVEISETAAELGKGNYDLVFRGSGYHEMVRLADVLTEASRELSKTEELRRELIANVSHDLRTPLTLISGYSEMIRDMPEEAVAENMQVIIDETKRLTLLVNDLLALSKFQSGAQEMRLIPFDINELAEDIALRVARFYEKDGYAIVFEPVGECFVNGDKEHISQVIYNFVLNAVEHAGTDKKVEISLKKENGYTKLAVRDSGEGIPPEDIARIWERYYRSRETYSRTASGTGLGLSIVKSILDRHPGVEYGVESNIGEGSIFWFKIKNR